MNRTVVLSSPANALLKDVRRAAAAGSLTGHGLAIAESFHLLEEAVRSGVRIESVLASRRVADQVEAMLPDDATVYLLDDGLFNRISSTATAQGVMALVQLPEWTPAHVFAGNPLVIALDGVQDPGNCGAIVRSAEAFGATGVVFLKGSANPHHPKTLRAAAGSLFRLPYVAQAEAEDFVSAVRDSGSELYVAAAQATQALDDIDFRRPSSIVIGSEGRGVRAELAGIAKPFSIVTRQVESLNAAVAAAVMLYEAQRQRKGRDGSV